MSSTHSKLIAQFQELHSPAAERNKAPILRALRTQLPKQGTVLELASGALQHALHFAPHFPHLHWQPTEVDQRVLGLAGAYADALGSQWPSNLARPLRLQVGISTWPVDRVDVIYLANLLHISPFSVTEALMHESPTHLTEKGALLIYGPFKEGDAFRSAGDAQFDRSLKQRDPEWGIRDLEAVQTLGKKAGLRGLEVIPMPANNLLLRLTRQ
ncbi:MAG: DUF938 domain-containing protein [Pseudomonadales bacterium]